MTAPAPRVALAGLLGQVLNRSAARMRLSRKGAEFADNTNCVPVAVPGCLPLVHGTGLALLLLIHGVARFVDRIVTLGRAAQFASDTRDQILQVRVRF